MRTYPKYNDELCDTARRIISLSQKEDTHPAMLLAHISLLCAWYFGIDRYSMKVRKGEIGNRANNAPYVRQVVMWIIRHNTDLSLPSIARFMGAQDHTTIMHGLRAIDKRLTKRGATARYIDTLHNYLALPPRKEATNGDQ